MITCCPSTLAEGYSTYSPVALKKLFDGKKVSHIIPYHAIESNEEDAGKFMENRKRISISGVQNKYSMVAADGELRLTDAGEPGRYILKPKPADLRLPAEIPANENLTMQIAEQIFGIETAANGLCFYLTGEAAYLTRRFDVLPDGRHLRKEDTLISVFFLNKKPTAPRIRVIPINAYNFGSIRASVNRSAFSRIVAATSMPNKK